MISLSAGSSPQWLLLGAFITAFFTALGIWFKYGPARMHAENATKIIDNDAAAVLRTEYTAMHQQDRKDIHFLKNELTKVMAEQIDCARELTDAHAINRANRDDMRTMMFLIRLLISEVKRLDPDPDNNIIINQCDEIMGELDRRTHATVVAPNTNGKSGGLKAIADTAVADATQALASTKETRAEIDSKEEKE